MEFVNDLSGGSTAYLKKYQVAATNTTIGIPYLKVADGGTGVVLATVSGAVDFVGVNVDAAGTYVTSQQTDNSDTARLTTLILNPHAIYRARLCGGAANEALTAGTVSSASTTGLVVTVTGIDPNSPDLNEGTVWGYTGANSGRVRAIITTSTGVANTTVAFPFDTAVGDQFLFANLRPLRTILAQFTTDMTAIDASATLSGDATAVTIEMILNDAAGDGTTNSYGLIQFADSLFLSAGLT
jgi:hypothetical protein